MSRKKKIAGDGAPPPDGPTEPPDGQSADDLESIDAIWTRDLSPGEKRRLAQTRLRWGGARRIALDFLAIRWKEGAPTFEELLDKGKYKMTQKPSFHVRLMLRLALTLTDCRASREPRPGNETPLDLDLMQRREQAELYRKAIEAGEAFEAALKDLPVTLSISVNKRNVTAEIAESRHWIGESLKALREGKKVVDRVLVSAEKIADDGKPIAGDVGQPLKWEALFVILARWVAVNLAAKKEKIQAEVDKFCAERGLEIFGQSLTIEGINKRVENFRYSVLNNRDAETDRRIQRDRAALQRLVEMADALANYMKWKKCGDLEKTKQFLR